MNVIQTVNQDGLTSGKAARPLKMYVEGHMTLDDFSWTDPLSD